MAKQGGVMFGVLLLMGVGCSFDSKLDSCSSITFLILPCGVSLLTLGVYLLGQLLAGHLYHGSQFLS